MTDTNDLSTISSDPFAGAPRWLAFLLRRRTRYALAWAATALATFIAVAFAWTWCDSSARGDGNWGHASIDFGGQWIKARMVATGQGRTLYHRGRLRTELEDALPRAGEAPDQGTSDVERMMNWMMGDDDPAAAPAVAALAAPVPLARPLETATLLAAARPTWTEDRLRAITTPIVGGALYPPVHAVLLAPLGMLPPPVAYRVMQLLNLALVFVTGWLVRELSGGRIWWPVATTLIMLFPGYGGSLNLGQNPTISLTLLLAGWLQVARGRPAWGGACWGFLAFKPVWAAAFLPALLLTRRWRAAGAMLLTGIALGLCTLPLVGLQTWFDWLEVGRYATGLYDRDENWTFLSRDLVSLPRRYLLTFDGTVATNPDDVLARVLGLALWLGVFAVTAVVALRRPRQVAAIDGPAAAFVLLGAWFSCFHFMYYDVQLAILPLCLLFTPPGACEPRRLLRSFPFYVLALVIATAHLGAGLDRTWHFPPWETFGLLLVWAWCGWQTVAHTHEVAVR